MHKMNPADLYITGYTYTFDETICELILPHLENVSWVERWDKEDRDPNDYESTDLPEPYTDDLKQAMQDAQEYLGKTYVSLVDDTYTKGYRNIWKRSANTVMRWHNDLPEGYNLFFLCYLSDVNQGGEICFRSYGQETGCLQPRKGMIVMASQLEYIQHKVNPNPPTETRMVTNFGFNLENFR